MLERIAELKSELNFIDRHKPILEKEKIEVKELEKEKNNKYEVLKKENMDVELLEKLSFRFLYHSLLGDKQEQLDFEKQEAMQANIEYQRVLNDYEYKLDYIAKLEERINNEDHIMQELKDLQSKVHINNQEILDYSDRIIDLQSQLKEVNEALSAGENALKSVLEVQKSLKSANNWATADMLDVNFSGIVKRDYIRKAQKQSQEADNNMKRFEKELKDVTIISMNIVSLDEFDLTFDILFDNIFTDYAIKNRIKESLRSTTKTLTNIESLVRELKEKQSNLLQELNNNRNSLKQLLQSL